MYQQDEKGQSKQLLLQQITSLKKQVDLMAQQNSIIEKNKQQYEKQNKEFRNKISKLQQENAEIRTINHQFDEENSQLRHQYEQLVSTLDQRNQQIANLQSGNQALQKQMADLKGKMSELSSSQIARLQSQFHQSQEQVKRLNRALEERQICIKQLQELIDQQNKDSEAANLQNKSVLKQFQKEKEKMQSRIQELDTELQEAEADNFELKNALAQSKDQVARLKRQNERIASSLQECGKRNQKSLQAQRTQAKSMFAELRNTIRIKHIQNRQLNSKMERMQREMGELKASCEQLQGVVSVQESQVSVVRGALTSWLQQQKRKLQQQLKQVGIIYEEISKMNTEKISNLNSLVEQYKQQLQHSKSFYQKTLMQIGSQTQENNFNFIKQSVQELQKLKVKENEAEALSLALEQTNAQRQLLAEQMRSQIKSKAKLNSDLANANKELMIKSKERNQLFLINEQLSKQVNGQKQINRQLKKKLNEMVLLSDRLKLQSSSLKSQKIQMEEQSRQMVRRLQTASKQADQKLESVVFLNKRLSQMTLENSTKEMQLQFKQTIIKSLQGTLDQKQKQLQKKGRQVGEMQSEKHEFVRQSKQLKFLNSNLNNEIQIQQTHIQILLQNQSNLKKELQSLRQLQQIRTAKQLHTQGELAKLTNTLHAFQSDLTRHVQELKQRNHELTSQQIKNLQLQSQLNMQTLQLDKLQSQNHQHQLKQSYFSTNCEQLQSAHIADKLQQRTLLQQNQTLCKQINTQHAALSAQGEQLNKLRYQLSQKERQVFSLNQSLASLRSSMQKNIGEIDQLRGLVQELEKQREKAVLRTTQLQYELVANQRSFWQQRMQKIAGIEQNKQLFVQNQALKTLVSVRDRQIGQDKKRLLQKGRQLQQLMKLKQLLQTQNQKEIHQRMQLQHLLEKQVSLKQQTLQASNKYQIQIFNLKLQKQKLQESLQIRQKSELQEKDLAQLCSQEQSRLIQQLSTTRLTLQEKTFRIRQLQMNASSSQIQLNKLRSQTEERRGVQSQCHKGLLNIVKEKQLLRKRVDQLQLIQSQSRRRIQLLQNQNKNLKDGFLSAKQQVSQSKSSFSRLKTQIHNQADLKQLQLLAQRDALLARCQWLERDLKAGREQLQSAGVRHQERREQLQSQMGKLEEKMKQSWNEKEELRVKAQKSAKLYLQKEQQIKTLNQNNRQLQSQFNLKLNQILSHKQRLSLLNLSLRTLQSQLQQNTASLSLKEKHIQTLQLSNTQMKTQIGIYCKAQHNNEIQKNQLLMRLQNVSLRAEKSELVQQNIKSQLNVRHGIELQLELQISKNKYIEQHMRKLDQDFKFKQLMLSQRISSLEFKNKHLLQSQSSLFKQIITFNSSQNDHHQQQHSELRLFLSQKAKLLQQKAQIQAIVQQYRQKQEQKIEQINVLQQKLKAMEILIIKYEKELKEIQQKNFNMQTQLQIGKQSLVQSSMQQECLKKRLALAIKSKQTLAAQVQSQRKQSVTLAKQIQLLNQKIMRVRIEQQQQHEGQLRQLKTFAVQKQKSKQLLNQQRTFISQLQQKVLFLTQELRISKAQLQELTKSLQHHYQQSKKNEVEKAKAQQLERQMAIRQFKLQALQQKIVQVQNSKKNSLSALQQENKRLINANQNQVISLQQARTNILALQEKSKILDRTNCLLEAELSQYKQQTIDLFKQLSQTKTEILLNKNVILENESDKQAEIHEYLTHASSQYEQSFSFRLKVEELSAAIVMSRIQLQSEKNKVRSMQQNMSRVNKIRQHLELQNQRLSLSIQQNNSLLEKLKAELAYQQERAFSFEKLSKGLKENQELQLRNFQNQRLNQNQTILRLTEELSQKCMQIHNIQCQLRATKAKYQHSQSIGVRKQDNLKQRLQQKQQQNLTALRKISQLKEQVQGLSRREFQHRQVSYQSWQSTQQQLRQTIDSILSQNTTLRNLIENFSDEKSRLQVELFSQKSRNQKHQANREQLAKQISQLKSKCLQLADANRKLQTQKQSLRSVIQQLQSKILLLKQTQISLKIKMEFSQGKNNESLTKLTQFESHKLDLNNKIDQLQCNNQTLFLQTIRLKDQLCTQSKRSQTLSEELSQFKNKNVLHIKLLQEDNLKLNRQFNQQKSRRLASQLNLSTTQSKLFKQQSASNQYATLLQQHQTNQSSLKSQLKQTVAAHQIKMQELTEQLQKCVSQEDYDQSQLLKRALQQQNQSLREQLNSSLQVLEQVYMRFNTGKKHLPQNFRVLIIQALQRHFNQKIKFQYQLQRIAYLLDINTIQNIQQQVLLYHTSTSRQIRDLQSQLQSYSVTLQSLRVQLKNQLVLIQTALRFQLPRKVRSTELSFCQQTMLLLQELKDGMEVIRREVKIWRPKVHAY